MFFKKHTLITSATLLLSIGSLFSMETEFFQYKKTKKKECTIPATTMEQLVIKYKANISLKRNEDTRTLILEGLEEDEHCENNITLFSQIAIKDKESNVLIQKVQLHKVDDEEHEDNGPVAHFIPSSEIKEDNNTVYITGYYGFPSSESGPPELIPVAKCKFNLLTQETYDIEELGNALSEYIKSLN